MSTPASLPVGRLLRADIGSFVVGIPTRRLAPPLAFGSLVTATVDDTVTLYGLVADMRIPDDDLVRQLALAATPPDAAVIADQRENRLAPVEIHVLTVGYQDARGVHYLLPPRPPLSLTAIHVCPADAVVTFTTAGAQPGYLRHVVRAQELPVADLVAAHLSQAQQAHTQHPAGRASWARDAVQYLIQLLRDDYELLSQVLDAVRDALPRWDSSTPREARL